MFEFAYFVDGCRRVHVYVHVRVRVHVRVHQRNSKEWAAANISIPAAPVLICSPPLCLDSIRLLDL